MCLLCIWSEFNTIIVYTKASSRSEENRGSSMQRPIKSTIYNPSDFRTNLPTPMPLWPSVRSTQWSINALQPHIILSKDTSGAGPSTYYIHLNPPKRNNSTCLITSFTNILLFNPIKSLHNIRTQKIWCTHQKHQGPHLQFLILPEK